MKQMKYKKQIQLIAAIVTLIVFPVITFYLMEAYTHNPFEEVRPWAQFLYLPYSFYYPSYYNYLAL